MEELMNLRITSFTSYQIAETKIINQKLEKQCVFQQQPVSFQVLHYVLLVLQHSGKPKHPFRNKFYGLNDSC